MPDLRISQLTSGGLAQATDEIVVARTGGNNKITAADIAAAATRVGTLTSLAVSGNGVLQTINGSASAFTDYRIGGVSQARVGTQNFATGDLSLLTLTAAPVVFGTNNSEKMRLDGSGNLGLGVTPSAWISGATSLDIRSTSAFADVGGSTTIANNSYRNSGGGWVYKTTNFASRLETDSGTFRWLTAPSGTAGDPITFAQPMTLDANGNLGVGTASPSFRLHAQVASGADREIFIAGVTGTSNGFTVKWNHANTKTYVAIANIPTSSAGLPAGTLWSDGGTIKIA